jgi:hypothetical protein
MTVNPLPSRRAACDPASPRIDALCAQILRRIGLGLLWDDGRGPTRELYALHSEQLSPYQDVAVRTAIAIYEGKLPPETALILGLQ